MTLNLHFRRPPVVAATRFPFAPDRTRDTVVFHIRDAKSNEIRLFLPQAMAQAFARSFVGEMDRLEQPEVKDVQ